MLSPSDRTAIKRVLFVKQEDNEDGLFVAGNSQKRVCFTRQEEDYIHSLTPAIATPKDRSQIGQQIRLRPPRQTRSEFLNDDIPTLLRKHRDEKSLARLWALEISASIQELAELWGRRPFKIPTFEGQTIFDADHWRRVVISSLKIESYFALYLEIKGEPEQMKRLEEIDKFLHHSILPCFIRFVSLIVKSD